MKIFCYKKKIVHSLMESNGTCCVYIMMLLQDNMFWYEDYTVIENMKMMIYCDVYDNSVLNDIQYGKGRRR